VAPTREKLTASADWCDAKLDDANVVRFDALAALAEFELDLLARQKGATTAAFNVGEVNENVLAVFAGKESVSLFVIEELHGTDWHCFLIS
jgi:hypothetical protein